MSCSDTTVTNNEVSSSFRPSHDNAITRHSVQVPFGSGYGSRDPGCCIENFKVFVPKKIKKKKKCYFKCDPCSKSKCGCKYKRCCKPCCKHSCNPCDPWNCDYVHFYGYK